MTEEVIRYSNTDRYHFKDLFIKDPVKNLELKLREKAAELFESKPKPSGKSRKTKAGGKNGKP